MRDLTRINFEENNVASVVIRKKELQHYENVREVVCIASTKCGRKENKNHCAYGHATG